MWRLAWFCTQEMDSTPPATKMSPSPAMMRCAAMAMVCSPEEQNRLMVTPETVTGQPAISAIWRAMLPPVAPSGVAQPISTSSTSPASMPARSMAARTTWPPMVAPWVMFRAPRQDLARPVRAVETITASRMSGSFLESAVGDQPLKPLPSAASRASSGAGVQKAVSPWPSAAKPFMRLTTLYSPQTSA